MMATTMRLGILLAVGAWVAANPEEKSEGTMEKTLQQVVRERAFPEYREWWIMGEDFTRFMSEAIVSEWSKLPGNEGDLHPVEAFTVEYLKTVYDREPRAALVEEFVHKSFSQPLASGEFDALSYAFFRSAFELMSSHRDRYELSLERERRSFTQRVGKKFFRQVQAHLDLELPGGLTDLASFEKLKDDIAKVGAFLKAQGYLRDHVAFRFDVEVERQGKRIVQSEADFLKKVTSGETALALYEMGYPAILPSAVYLFHTLGEAQHHSSRTIEELFGEVGFSARETADFDPIGHPSDLVVEVWEISKKP